MKFIILLYTFCAISFLSDKYVRKARRDACIYSRKVAVGIVQTARKIKWPDKFSQDSPTSNLITVSFPQTNGAF